MRDDFSDQDRVFIAEASAEAQKGLEEGGVPVGAILVEDGKVVARGRNRRIQDGNPIAHGEMDCLSRAGRREQGYRATTLYTTLSPCMMCSGAIVQFGIRRVVIGDTTNFVGNIDFLRQRGVTVIVGNSNDCIERMRNFIRDNPTLWAEDIAED